MARVTVNFAWSDFIDSKLYVLASIDSSGRESWTNLSISEQQLMVDDIVVDESADGFFYVGVVQEDGSMSWDSKHTTLERAREQGVKRSREE